MGAVRRVVRCVACAVVALPGIALSPLVGKLPAGVRDRLVRRWARAVAASLGVRVRVVYDPGARPLPGVRAERGELIVANHISWLDIPVLAMVRPARMVAKREVGEWPVAGWLVARAGTLFVSRDRPRALPGDVAAIAAALRSGSAVGAFPEGSTWCGARQGPFRRAVFQAALDADALVRPVAIAYRHGKDGPRAQAAAFVGDDTLGASVWRLAGARGVVAEVRVKPPFSARAHPDRRAAATAAEHACCEGKSRPEALTTPNPPTAATGPPRIRPALELPRTAARPAESVRT
ncbi:lysophospholipid acyltransferase family protein [Yinghuangia soli]|uniref:1-acyl-sn-glycerol-3-phosphate acyltransferase n=1 Tax=Yinghuangia soli TaxID=2908204 RepID=A0AA41U5F9_9ACTN|nr:lysophospholipid acyltransferase family protein [Yinghuangia soli]MCF2529949.1 1-acyl-sn-glycerol-3-phosphate acyltransferase [Yinghuangia soli]